MSVKLFHFYRKEDQTGVSGTGPVVEGVQFTNGWCAIRWISEMSSVCFYQSLEDVKKVHSHGGRTEIILHDFEPVRARETPSEAPGFEIFLSIIEELSGLMNLGADAAEERATQAQIREWADDIKERVDRLADRLCAECGGHGGPHGAKGSSDRSGDPPGEGNGDKFGSGAA